MYAEDDALSGKQIQRAVKGQLKNMPWLDSFLFSVFDKFASKAIRTGCMTIYMPDGRVRTYGDDNSCSTAIPDAPAWRELPPLRCSITIHNTDFFYKVMTRHDTGLGEAYMQNDYSVDNLGAFMAVVTANAYGIESNRGVLGVFNWIGDRLLYLAHLTRANTFEGSKKNISEHYDAGNDMYKLFLDSTLTYSSGIHNEGDSLEQAQFKKLDALIEGAQITQDSHVLEVGCGWGSCAIRAVQSTGCKWTGITVSQEQLTEAQERVSAAGLKDRIVLVFCDYREVVTRYGEGVFDAVISCEMIEAVGHEHLPLYFDIIGQALKPGGHFAMQVITIPDSRYAAYCAAPDFIKEYIFPGGHLPSISAMTACASSSHLVAVGLHDIGPDYALTLRAWRDSWVQNWQNITKLGYSEVFMRKFEFYFAYCEAAFDSRYLQDYQIVWQRVGAPHTQPSLKQRLQAVSSQKYLSCEAEKTETPEKESRLPKLSADTITSALFALYCVLAGVVVARQPRMLMALVSFAAGQIGLKVWKHVSPVVLPEFDTLSPPEQAAWVLDGMHAFWSLLVGIPALSLLISANSWAAALQPHDAAPALLVYIATGMWACHLAALVQSRLFTKRPAEVAHNALLLAIFASAAFKEEHTGLLAMTLPALLCCVPSSVSKAAECVDCSVRGLHTNWLHLVESTMNVLLNYCLHAVILLVVIASPDIWSSPVYYLLACNGMLYTNWVNASAIFSSPQGTWLRKHIRAAVPDEASLATHVKIM